MPTARSEVLKIVQTSRRIILGQLILPHIDKFKSIHVSENPMVDKQMFFQMLDTDDSDLGLTTNNIKTSPSTSQQVVEIGVDEEEESPSADLAASCVNTKIGVRDDETLTTATAFRKTAFVRASTELTEEQENIWADMCSLVKHERRHSLAHLYKQHVEEEDDDADGLLNPMLTVSINDPHTESIKALELIIIAVTASVSPIISRTQALMLLDKLKSFEDEDELNRNKFVLLVRQWSATAPELATIDIELLSLYLFPELEIEIYLLRRLIKAVTQPSEHHSFASAFSKNRIAQLGDFTEILFFGPFLVLFLAIVLSGKFVTPRTYYGYDAVKLVKETVLERSFEQFSPNGTNMGTTMLPKDIQRVEDIYAFLSNGFGGTIFTDNPERQIGNYLPIGAFKIRNMIVTGQYNGENAKNYFPDRKDLDFVFQGFDANANRSDLDMTTSSFQQYVLMPYDGTKWGSCSSLNGSVTGLGNSHPYECSGHAVVVPFRTNQTSFRKVIKGLMHNNWLDRASRGIITEFIVFHPISTMMVHCLTILEIRAGGGMSVTSKVTPFAFYTFTSNSPVVSSLYYVFFIYLFFLIVRTIYLHFVVPLTTRDERAKFSWWRVSDLINYAVFLISVISRIIWIAHGKPSDRVWQLDHYPDRYEYISILFTLIVTYDSFNVIVSVLGLLRFAQYVPGLDIVVGSLQRAAMDALALCFVIFGTFMSLVLCANAVFGDSVPGYHTIPWAAETLGQVFIGNYDYRSLHTAHPTFAFIFFFMFQIMMTVILVSMFVAVFTDSFGDTVDLHIDASQCRQILTSNTRHSMELRTIWGMAKGSFPVQTIYSVFSALKARHQGTPVDPYSYTKYYDLVDLCLEDIFTPEDIIKARRNLETDKDLNVLRIRAVHHLLTIIRHIPIPPQTMATVDAKRETTTIYDFAGDSLGSFDYPLLMTLFVMVPQQMFNLPGEYSLLQVLNKHKSWFHKASLSSLKAGEVDQLELRVRAIVAERDSREQGKRRRSTVVRTGTQTKFVSKAVKEFLASLDYIHRRLLFGLVCLGKKDDFSAKAVLTEELFGTLVSRCPEFPHEDLTVKDLHEHLRIHVNPNMRMKDLRDAALEELGEQCLSVECTASEVFQIEEKLKVLGKRIIDRDEFTTLWKEVRGTPSEALLNRLFSVFPDGKFDMMRFLHFARGNLSSHNFKSFESSFVQKSKSQMSGLLWFLFYIPFFSLILFFVNIQHGDHLWMVSNMRGNFPLAPNPLPADVNNFFQSTIDTIWSDPKGGAAPLTGANFFVGAIRIRQYRVTPVDCSRVFTDYFGNSAMRQMDFPLYFSAADKAYYINRVDTDFGILSRNLSCLSAFDFGQNKASVWNPYKAPAITSNIPEVLDAFTLREGGQLTSNDGIDAHHSQYSGGSFGFALNVSVSQAYARTAIRELLGNAWIDKQSRAIVIEFVSFNYNLGLFCRVRLGYELTAGGTMYPIDSMFIVSHESPTKPQIVILSIMMFVLLIIYGIFWVTRFRIVVYNRIKLYGDTAWIAPLMVFKTSPVLLVDALIIITFIITYVIRFGQSQKFELSGVTNNGMYPFGVEESAVVTQLMLKLMGINVFLVFLRFLGIISLMQPHVAVFFQTLSEASQDLLSIISLWIFALFTFTLSAVILFGYGTTECYNLQSAFFDLFNTASGGNPNYYDYTVSRREAASVFFIIYFVTCFFVLYNMVVAVLTGKFSDTKGNLYDDSVVREVLGEQSGFSFTRWVRNHVLFRECESMYYFVRYQGNVPIGLRYSNPRHLWTHMEHLWSLVDVGEPVEVVYGAASLVALSYEAGRLAWLDAITQRNDELTKQASESAVGSTTPAPTPKKHRDSALARTPSVKDHRNMHRSKYKRNDAVIRLRTITDRRQPLWEEFVFYRFGNERDCIHRYLVWLPSALLGVSQRDLWMQLLEEHHYYAFERQKYTVDLSESKLVQIMRILPETNDLMIKKLDLEQEESDVLREVFGNDDGDM